MVSSSPDSPSCIFSSDLSSELQTQISSCLLDIRTLMSNRHLKLNARIQAPDYLPSATSFLISANKCQTPSSSWTHPFLSLHISHSNQQQILLNLLLKSSHPPITTWSKTLPFLTWIILFASKLISLFSSLPAVVLNLNTTVQMCHLKGKPDHATLLHLTRQKIRSPNNGLQGTPPSGTIPPSLFALLPTTLPLAHSVLNSKAHSCFREFAFVFPSARNVLPPDTAGRAPSLLSGSTPTLSSHRSLPRGPSVLHPNQVYAAHIIKGLFFQTET